MLEWAGQKMYGRAHKHLPFPSPAGTGWRGTNALFLSGTDVKIGLVSDTHGFFDERLAELLTGVHTILHAGDVGSQEVLDRLALIAPTRAVKGNVDSVELGLPLSLSFEAEGVLIEVLHILQASQTQLQSWAARAGSQPETRRRDRFLATLAPATRIVIFGHSHRPGFYSLRQKLFVNPGSAGKKRFSLPRCCAVMEISRAGVEVKARSLEDYNENMIDSMRMNFGGSASCLH